MKIKDDGDLVTLIMESAEQGLDYWRPGDVKSAKEIIGTEAWCIIKDNGLEERAGKIFKGVSKSLGLTYVGRNTHKHSTYSKI